jgi:hypothetical protein
MNHRETIHNIREHYPIWKKIIELDYDLLGLADDIFVSSIRYYFSSYGFGIILSKEMLIVLGQDKEKVRSEALRLEKRVKLHQKKMITCLNIS